jgi:large subunit ribosomal protein L4
MEQIKVINQDNLPLNPTVWQVPLSHLNISLANRYYLANQRQGTKKVKSRGEVRGSTRKIYRQKGTGGARHGHRYAPQFRGGGVAFGPTGKENYSLNINKKFKKKVLQSILSEKMRNKEIIVVEKINLNHYKTKEAVIFLTALPTKKSKTLLVLAASEENKKEIIYSFRNLPYINITDSKSINTLQVLSPNYLLFTHASFTETEKRLS